MIAITHYPSPLGTLLLAADDQGLTHLALPGQRYQPIFSDTVCEKTDLPIFAETRHWLDQYFSGTAPSAFPPLHPQGSTFQLTVWQLLLTIPYGETTTYGAIAREIARMRGLARMSAQAVGGAVGHNPISIIIPCHRVVGTNGSLTGYGGGIDKKIALLSHEGVDMNHFFVPKKGTAL